MKSLIVTLCCIMMFFVTKASNGSDTSGIRGFFFRGTEFTKIFTIQSGTPFLNAEGASAGWVNYYGTRYNDVMIQYDIEDDQLVSSDITGFIRMQLVKEKISAFGYSGKEFIRYPGSDLFFERVYQGGQDVLIRWQKVFTRTGTEEGKYKLYKAVYIRKGSEVFQIQNNSDLAAFFGKNGRSIKEYMRKENLSVRKNPEKAVVAVVRYVDKNGLHEN